MAMVVSVKTNSCRVLNRTSQSFKPCLFMMVSSENLQPQGRNHNFNRLFKIAVLPKFKIIIVRCLNGNKLASNATVEILQMCNFELQVQSGIKFQLYSFRPSLVGFVCTGEEKSLKIGKYLKKFWFVPSQGCNYPRHHR